MTEMVLYKLVRVFFEVLKERRGKVERGDDDGRLWNYEEL